MKRYKILIITPERYFSLNKYFQQKLGFKVAKISLDAGLTCPNRDGTLSLGGCIFCDGKGSGSGAGQAGLSLVEQLETGLDRMKGRADKFMAYFQSYTNTYAPPEKLKRMWDQALAPDEIIGLAVGTRPDCLPDDVLDILEAYARDYEIWLELGLQSASDRTLALINRGHTADDFSRAVARARGRGIKILAHVILGLPGEGKKEVAATAKFLANLEISGVKIHSLYVPGSTELEVMYKRGDFKCLDQDEFVDLAVNFLELIPKEVVIHRLTGDPDPKTLVAPEWSLNKHRTISLIRNRMSDLNTWQGRWSCNSR
ncbi:MAG: TIGR01212 family radical SAM protein [Candidatus Adiutricales bacterium]